jgi:hypothetical protein
MIYQNRPADDLVQLRAQDLNAQLNDHVRGRTTFYFQWALALAGYYADPVDGTYRASTLAAANALLGANYGGASGEFGPGAGEAVSLKFLKAVMADYGFANYDGNVATVVQTPRTVVA